MKKVFLFAFLLSCGLSICGTAWGQHTTEKLTLTTSERATLQSNTLKALAPLMRLEVFPQTPEKRFSVQLDAVKAVVHAEEVDSGIGVKAAVWPKDRISALEVSWENPSPENEQERLLVQEAVAQTWEVASAVRFVGWQASTPTSKGIRIAIEDEEGAPHCKALGKYLDGRKDGMVLNFTFEHWCKECPFMKGGREKALQCVAVHEFGHALGFAHEQNSIDTPEWCKDMHLEQGTSGDIQLTEWDANSVMNYCNPEWNNGGILSERDRLAARILYGENK